MKKLLAWVLTTVMLLQGLGLTAVAQELSNGELIVHESRLTEQETVDEAQFADAPVELTTYLEEIPIDPLIVTTEGFEERGDGYSIEIYRPRVYSEANPALTHAVDNALEEIFAEAYEAAANTRLGCTNSSHADWEGCYNSEFAYLNNACVYGDLLMLTICHGCDDCGIGHTMSRCTDFYFSISEGKQIELNLRDILDTQNNPDAEDKFIALMEKKFREENSDASASKMYRELNEADYGCSWGLMPSGVGLSFDKLYFNDVPYSVSMSYGELDGILKKEFMPEARIYGSGVALALAQPGEAVYDEDYTVYSKQDSDYALTLDGFAHHFWVGKVYGYKDWELNGYCNYFYGYGAYDSVIELYENSYGEYCITYLDEEGAHRVTLPGGEAEHIEWIVGIEETDAVDAVAQNPAETAVPVVKQEAEAAESVAPPIEGDANVPADSVSESVNTPVFEWFIQTPAAGVSAAESSIGTYAGAYDVAESSYRTSNNPPVDGSRTVDGDLTSAWNSYDRIEGEWLQVSMSGGEYQIAGFRIASGYWKNSDVFKNNAKPKVVDVYCGDQFVNRFELENSRDYQTFWFERPVSGSSIKFVVVEGYDGRKYSDCCVTEIELLGPAGNQLNSQSLSDWGAAVQKAADTVLNGGEIEKGDYGLQVVGLQLLLRDGFGVLSGAVDGDFGSGTRDAVKALAKEMQEKLPECEEMEKGVVDAAFWRNMLAYMDMLQ